MAITEPVVREVVSGEIAAEPVVLTTSAAVRTGDVLVAFQSVDYGFASNVAGAEEGEWTERVAPNAVETNSLHHKVFTSRAGADGAQTYTFSNAAASTANMVVTLVVLDGATCLEGDPVGDAAGAFANDSSTIRTAPALEAVGEGALVLRAAATRTDATHTSAGANELADLVSETYVSQAVYAEAAPADEGAVATRTITASASAVWAASTIAIAGAPAEVPANATEHIVDSFDGAFDPVWTDVYGASINGEGQARLDCTKQAVGTPNYSGLKTAPDRSLVGSSIFFEVIAFPAATAADAVGDGVHAQAFAYATTAPDPGTRVGFDYNAVTGTLGLAVHRGYYDQDGLSPDPVAAFDPAATPWLKLDHTGTDLVWYRSADGLAWDEIGRSTVPAWIDNDDVQVTFETFRFSGANDAFIVDNVNVGPTEAPPPRSLAVGEPVEADTARPLARRTRRRTVGQVLDTSSATALERARTRALEAALEADTALQVSTRKPGEVATARETDTAHPFTRRRVSGTGQAHEDELARPLGRRTRRRTLGQALDTSSSTALERSKRRDVAQAGEETDTAAPLGRARTIHLGRVVEGDTAPGIAHRYRRRSVGQARESETARAVGRRHRRDVALVLEYDIARQLAQSTVVVSDEAYAAAIADPDRVPYGTLHVDWDSDGYDSPLSELTDNTRSLEIERSLDGDLPEGAGLIDGYATATLRAELGGVRAGASMPLVAEFSPFRPDSPLYGKRKTMREAVAEIGVVTQEGPRSDRLFTGPVRELSLVEADSSVTLDAVDPSERLRALITLPTYGEFVTHAMRRNWALTVNSQFVVDLVLRANGIYASPPPHPDAIISCTGHGGLVSEIGFNGAPISLPGQIPKGGLWTEDEHPYGMLGTPEPRDYNGTVGYQELYGTLDGYNAPFRFEAGNGVGVSMLAHLGSWMGFPASHEARLIQIRPGDITRDNADNETPRLFVNWYGDGGIYAGLVTDDGSIYATPRVPTAASPRWRHVGVHFRYASATQLVVTVRVDGTTRTYTVGVPAVTPANGYRPSLQVNPQMTRSWSNLSAWVGYDPPSVDVWQAIEGHVAQADIGRGNNELIYLPDVASAESWEVLKAVVTAEYAVHGFTEYGRYYFRPRTDVRPDRVDHTLDVESNLAEVSYSFSSDTIRNSVGVTVTPRYHSGEFQAVWKAQDVLQFVCPPGLTQWDLDWPWGAASRLGGLVGYYSCDDTLPDDYPWFWKTDLAEGWTYSYGTNWTGEQNPQIVYVTWCQIDRRKIRLSVHNTGNLTVRLATDANVADLAGQPGEPALHIGGWPMIDQPDRVTTWRNETSIAELGGVEGGGERALPIPSSEWRQDDAPFAPVAKALLGALAEEVPVLEDLPVKGDPRIRVGNVAACRFREGEVTVTGTVVRTRHQLSARGGFQTLVSVRPLPIARLAPPGFEFYVDVSHYQAEGSLPLDLGTLKVLGYAGVVAKIGQGAGTTADGGTLGALIDDTWTQWRDVGLSLWPRTTAGYWYVGSDEAPDDQAARCLAAVGDPSIPVMLDWEDGAGDFANLLDVLDAFRSAGLLVTMVYASRNYADGNAPAGASLAGRGVSLISARYWVDTPGAFPDPRADFDDQRDGFGFEPFLGLTPAANQFTQYGVPYSGAPDTDVDVFRGSAAELAVMFHGE